MLKKRMFEEMLRIEEKFIKDNCRDFQMCKKQSTCLKEPSSGEIFFAEL